MDHYEMLCVLPGTLTEEEVKKTMEGVLGAITNFGGSVIQSQDIGKNRLAYPIKHIRYGYFQLIEFSVEPDKLADIKRKAYLAGTLLRLVIKIHDPKQKKFDVKSMLAPQPVGSVFYERPDKESEAVREHEVHHEVHHEIHKERIKEIPEVSLAEIDERLDEILQKDLDKV
ncbi:MAG: 30S ribosomal protein S6 [Candidatus Magasanikbacteria bacterium]|nr:30S ribosomal protein S6 [Candidatus Magasanikbacteria bacterium]